MEKICACGSRNATERTGGDRFRDVGIVAGWRLGKWRRWLNRKGRLNKIRLIKLETGGNRWSLYISPD